MLYGALYTSSVTKTLTAVRIEPPLLQRVDSLADSVGSNRSETIRAAVRLLCDLTQTVQHDDYAPVRRKLIQSVMPEGTRNDHPRTQGQSQTRA